MKADQRFIGQPHDFWANVRTISQEVGYTERGKGTILIPSLNALREKFFALGLSTGHIAHTDKNLTAFGIKLLNYFEYRAQILNDVIRSQLMNKAEATLEF